MKHERWKTGSVEGFDESWKTIEPRFLKRYSEGDVLRYPQYMTYLQSTLVEEIALQEEGCLSIELGCGRADTSLFFAKRGWQPVLMDISQVALEIAENNFSEEKAPCLLVRGDLLSASFRNGSFDVVMNFGVLEHFEDPIHPLREMVRILKPGGTLCASVVYTRRFSLQALINWLYHIPGTVVKYGVLGRDPLKAREMLAQWRGGGLYENDLRMEDYISRMKRLGLIEVKAIPCTTIPDLKLPLFLETLYIRCIKVFCAIKRRMMGVHPLKAIWSGRRVSYLVGKKSVETR